MAVIRGSAVVVRSGWRVGGLLLMVEACGTRPVGGWTIADEFYRECAEAAESLARSLEGITQESGAKVCTGEAHRRAACSGRRRGSDAFSFWERVHSRPIFVIFQHAPADPMPTLPVGLTGTTGLPTGQDVDHAVLYVVVHLACCRPSLRRPHFSASTVLLYSRRAWPCRRSAFALVWRPGLAPNSAKQTMGHEQPVARVETLQLLFSFCAQPMLEIAVSDMRVLSV